MPTWHPASAPDSRIVRNRRGGTFSVEYDDLGRITTLPARYAGPQEAWHVAGKTLSELELKSTPFYSAGHLALNFPSWWSVMLECEMDSSGELSATEGIQESFELWGCGLYEVKGGEKGKKLSCGPIEASLDDYTGKASGMRLHLHLPEGTCLWSEMEIAISSFDHEFPSEEATRASVKTTAKASFGENPVEISATSTWELDGAQAGKTFGFSASGPVPNEGGLATGYFVNDLTHTQSQGGITNTYNLDAAGRERERITTGGSEEGTEIYHYAGGSDSPAWIEDIKGEETSWTRNISALGGGLGAIENDKGEVTLQLANMHGDVVATAEDNYEAPAVLSTQRFDEFGNPLQQSRIGFLQGGDPEYGWLGARGRRTQLPSGVIQMGVRSYVPALGRFLTPDPVAGGSANAYDYANQDPVNDFDLTGKAASCRAHPGRCKGHQVKSRAERRIEHRTRRLARENHLKIPVGGCHGRGSCERSWKHAEEESVGHAVGGALDAVFGALSQSNGQRPVWSAVKSAVSAYIRSANEPETQKIWSCAKEASDGWMESRDWAGEDGPEASGAVFGYVATKCGVGWLGG